MTAGRWNLLRREKRSQAGFIFGSTNCSCRCPGSLGTPQQLACPADMERWASTNFNRFSNWNLSYALGVEADPLNSSSILAADRNFPTVNTAPLTPNPTIGLIPSPTLGLWGSNLHGGKGNVVFADNHVEESRNALLSSEEIVGNELFYPDVSGTPGSGPTGGSAGVAGSGGGSTGSGASRSSGTPSAPQYYYPGQPGTPNSHYAGASTLPLAAASRPSSQPANSAVLRPTLAAKPAPVAVASAFESSFSNAATENPLSVTNVPASLSGATNAPDAELSPFNREIAHYLRCIFGSIFLLLLLLLLIEIWRRYREKMEKDRRRGGIQQ